MLVLAAPMVSTHVPKISADRKVHLRETSRCVPSITCPGKRGLPSSPGWGYPMILSRPGGTFIQSWRGGGYPKDTLSRKDMGPVEVLWNGDGVPRPPPGVDWHTNWNHYLPHSFGIWAVLKSIYDISHEDLGGVHPKEWLLKYQGVKNFTLVARMQNCNYLILLSSEFCSLLGLTTYLTSLWSL